MQLKLLRKSLCVVLLPLFAQAQADTTSSQKSFETTHYVETHAFDTVAQKLNFGNYFHLLGSDIARQVSTPLHASNRQWLGAGKFALISGVVALANKPVNQFAVKLHNNNTGLATTSRYVTNCGGIYEVYALAGFYAFGVVSKNQKAKTTALLATQAYITAGLISGVAKFIFGEQRPYYTDPLTQKRGPIFRGPFYGFKKDTNGKRLGFSDFSSFPSGHTTAAFAAATVFATAYNHKPIIPIISYAGASLIGLSRLTENKHWPADVLVGAMLGYLSGKQVVKNYRRFAATRTKTSKNLHLNLQMVDKRLLPGLVYSF